MNQSADFIVVFALIPLAAALVSAALVNQRWLSRMLGVASFASCAALAIALLARIYMAGGEVLVTYVGGWQPPLGICLVFDSFSGLMLAASSLVALGSYIHSFSSLEANTERRYYHPLIQALMFGVNLSFLTGDLFNLFVAFEIMLMSSYALMCIGSSHEQLRQAYKYVVLNILSSTIFLMAAGMTYGMFGTLNIADLARMVAERQAAGEPMPTGFTGVAVAFLVVFGLKGAFFPLWFWLPDTYYTVPTAVGGLFAGMLTKVGVYSIARLFPLVFAQISLVDGDAAGTRTLILSLIAISAAFTMFLGVLGAVSQHQIRRILAVHVISQVGYMVFGLAVMSSAALAGCIFYMIQHMVVKCSLFLCCGVMERYGGSDDLDKLGGLLRRAPWLGVLFFVAALSLAGLPPLSGFFGKLPIMLDGWENHAWLVGFALATSLLTLLSMLKIWSYAFWSPMPERVAQHSQPDLAGLRWMYVGAAMLVAVALFLGFGAEPVFRVAQVAGDQLVDPTTYIHAVLGPEGLVGIEGIEGIAGVEAIDDRPLTPIAEAQAMRGEAAP